MSRFLRIALTVGLGVTGAVLGALCGVVLMTVADVIIFGMRGLRLDIAEAVAAQVGALLGAVLAPTSAWLLMRHVPLWRAILDPTIGTCVGALAGILMGRDDGVRFVLGLSGAIVGFIVSVFWLRIVKRPPSHIATSPAA